MLLQGCQAFAKTIIIDSKSSMCVVIPQMLTHRPNMYLNNFNDLLCCAIRLHSTVHRAGRPNQTKRGDYIHIVKPALFDTRGPLYCTTIISSVYPNDELA